MTPPGFWDNPPDSPGWQARLLAPASALWQLVARLRAAGSRTRRVAPPVLCIGNLVAGGAGKTPMVAALMERLAARGVSAHVVSRGYGGRIVGPHLVDPLDDTAVDVGDEPLMLAARGLVWIARDRAAGATRAAEGGAPLILLDDGFQNPGLAKDAAILMVDAVAGFGNGRVIPAGPLREPVAEGLARADLIVLVGAPEARARATRRWLDLQDVPMVGAQLVPLKTGWPLEGEDVVAFAGIGRPEKFFDTVRSMGANLIATHAFPDHHSYPPRIVRRLIAEARQSGAVAVTTEKDAVRLPADLRGEVVTIQVSLELEDWSAVDDLLARLLGQ